MLEIKKDKNMAEPNNYMLEIRRLDCEIRRLRSEIRRMSTLDYMEEGVYDQIFKSLFMKTLASAVRRGTDVLAVKATAKCFPRMRWQRVVDEVMEKYGDIGMPFFERRAVHVPSESLHRANTLHVMHARYLPFEEFGKMEWVVRDVTQDNLFMWSVTLNRKVLIRERLRVVGSIDLKYMERLRELTLSAKYVHERLEVGDLRENGEENWTICRQLMGSR